MNQKTDIEIKQFFGKLLFNLHPDTCEYRIQVERKALNANVIYVRVLTDGEKAYVSIPLLNRISEFFGTDRFNFSPDIEHGYYGSITEALEFTILTD